jgi:hypothetical protein
MPQQTVENILAQPARQAITTRIAENRATGDYEIIASCDAKMIVWEWDDRLDIPGNHAAAALKLLTDLGWHERNHLVMGGHGPEGYVFVQVPAPREGGQ